MEAAQIPWRPIGELFVEKGLITADQLEEALAEQMATGLRLGEILVQRSLISSPELTHALMEQLGREVAKEEGFGTGLWAEIRRRNASPGSVDKPSAESYPDRSPFGEGLARKLAIVDDEQGPTRMFEEESSLAEFREPGAPAWEDDDDRAEGRASEYGAEAELEIELEAARSELHVRWARIEELERTLFEREERIGDLQRSVEELRSSEPEPADELDALQAAQAAAAARASELEEILGAEREAHEETRRVLGEAERAEQDARHALQEIERGLVATQGERDAARSEAASARDELSAERAAHDELRGRIEQTAAEAGEARRALDDVTRERDELAQRAHALEQELGERDGDRNPREDADEAIRRLLHEAEERATELAEAEVRLHDAEARAAQLSSDFAEERSELERKLTTLEAQFAESSATDADAAEGDGDPAPADYLCFTPTSDGYRLLARTGVLPTAGEPYDVDGVAHVVTRIAGSPLPFDARSCVYLIASA